MAVTLELQPDGAIKVSRILRAPGAIIAASRALEAVAEYAFEPVKVAQDDPNVVVPTTTGPVIPEGQLLSPSVAAALARNCEVCEE